MPSLRAALPYLATNQSQKETTHNEALNILDFLINAHVINTTTTAPPGSPTNGDCYLVATGATGAWDGEDDAMAFYLDGWNFIEPYQGMRVFDDNTGKWLTYDSGAWGPEGLNGFDMVGINTTADATNRLAVKSNAILFSHDDVTPGTGDLQVTLNKSAAGKDAGFTFQDAFSTRALFGLLGDDDWTVKVSPDGSTFYTGLVIDKDTGNVAIGSGSDGTNKLLVAGTNMLFTSSGSLAFTFNKNATANDCSLTFQKGFSARALVGLLGTDDFTFKVTPDASNYFTAFVIDKDDGSTTYEAPFAAKRSFPTPSAGTLTLTTSYACIQGGTATVSTLTGPPDGTIVVLQNTGGGTITINNSGNIKPNGGTSMVLDSFNDAAIFANCGGTWVCAGFSNNG